jgi:hypothetical protein
MAKPIKKPCYPTKTNSTYKWHNTTLNAAHFPYFLLLFLLLLPRYLSTALRIYLLLGISPRLWSIFIIVDLGKVIPSFTVKSILAATIVLLVILVECTTSIAKSFSLADCIKLLWYYIVYIV